MRVALDAVESLAISAAAVLWLSCCTLDSFVTDRSVSSSVPAAAPVPPSSSFNTPSSLSARPKLSPVPVRLNLRAPLSSLLTGLTGLPVPRLPRRISENECMRAAVPLVAAMKPGGRSVSSSLREAERRRLVAVVASEAVLERAAEP